MAVAVALTVVVAVAMAMAAGALVRLRLAGHVARRELHRLCLGGQRRSLLAQPIGNGE